MRKYELIWSDEFDHGNKPDPEKWAYDIGSGRWGNGETQYYTEGDNVFIRDSVLTIEGRIESYQGSPYTSARLITYGKKHFQYGRIAVRAKIPTAKGSWPAIWMLPIDMREEGVPWPKCGEIDIMEHVTSQFDTVHVSLHTALFNHIQRTQRTHFEHIPGITSDFHEFAFDWFEDRIDFFVDGRPFGSYSRHDEGYTPDADGWPFSKPYYLILNQAIGGTWGGEVDPKDYPSPFQIDYVRYYRIHEE